MAAYVTRGVFNSKEFQYVLEIDFQIDSFREYIHLTEKVIDIDVKSKIDSYNKFLKEATEIEIEHMHDFQDHEIKIHTRQLYYSSLFISLYSFLEKKMYQLCRIAEDSQSTVPYYFSK